MPRSARHTLNPADRPVAEVLEPRLLYSADGPGGLLSVLPDDEGVWTDHASPDEHRLGILDAPDLPQVLSAARSVALVDAAVPDRDVLVAALGVAGHDVVLVAADDDLRSIADKLAGHSELESLHVFAHGADGALFLGGTRLDAAALGAEADTMRDWGMSLAEDGDLVLWGCEVAGTSSGLRFVDALAVATGADVAASDDVTGGRGDWTLEVIAGEVDARALDHGADLAAWHGELRTIVVSNTADGLRATDFDFNDLDSVDPATVTLREAIMAINRSGGDPGDPDVIVLGSGTYALSRDLGAGGDGDDANFEGDLDILRSMTIRGAGADQTTIEQLLFDRVFDTDNAAIGPIDLNMEDLSIRGGNTDREGGGLRLDDDTTATLRNVTFDGNAAADEGGAIFSRGTLTAIDALFRNNAADKDGGAVYVRDDLASSFTRVYFDDNRAIGQRGGAVYVHSSAANVVFSGISFHANLADEGGALYVHGDGASVLNSTFSGNAVSGKGGAMLVDADVAIVSSTFFGNSAAMEAGALSVKNGNVTVLNSLFHDNWANGGLEDVEGTVDSLGYNLFSTSLNMAGQFADGDAIYVGPTSALIDLSSYDVNATLPGYELQTGSVAIDAGRQLGPIGSSVVDRTGLQRDEIPDIGASEYGAPGDVVFVSLQDGRIIRADPDIDYEQAVTSGRPTGADAPTDLEVDIAARQLFWLERQGAEIWTSGLDASGTAAMLPIAAGPAAGIAVDTVNRRLFVVTAGATPELRTYAYDGTAISSTVPLGVGDATDLAYDERTERIYWTNVLISRVLSAADDVSDVRVVANGSSYVQPGGLSIDAAGHRLFAVGANGTELVTQGTDRGTHESIAVDGDDVAYAPVVDRVYTTEPGTNQLGSTDENLATTSTFTLPGLGVSVAVGTTDGFDPSPIESGTFAVSTVVGGNALIDATVVGATDNDAYASEPQLTWSLVAAPTHGRVEIDSSDLTALPADQQYLTQAEIGDPGTVVRYVHTGAGDADDSFTLQLSDGTNAPLAIRVVDVTVIDQNDDPVLTTQPVSVGERATRLLSTADLNVTDADQPGVAPGTVYSIDTSGTGLTLYNTATSSSVASFNWTALDAGDIELRADDTEPTGAPIVLTVDVVDGDGGSDSASWSVTVTNANDEPVLTTLPVSVGENGSRLLTAADLNVTDADQPGVAPGTVYSVDTSGTGLTLYNTATSSSVASFNWTALDAGDIELRADDTEPTGAPIVLTVDVVDGDGGSDSASWSVTVTNANDEPVLTTQPVSVGENGSRLLTTADLNVTDADQPGVAPGTVYSVDTSGTGLTLYNTATSSSVASFNWTALDAGDIELRADDTEPTGAPIVLTVDVVDGDGGSDSASWSVTVTNANDEPVLTTQPVSVGENGSRLLTTADLNVTDADQPGVAPGTVYSVDTSGTGLTLYNTATSSSVASFNWTALDAGDIELRADDTEPTGAPIVLTVDVVDGDGGSDSASWSVTVTNANDEPVLTTQPVSVGENGSRLLTAADLDVTDVDQPGVAPGTVYSVDTSGTGLTLYNTATSSSVASFNWTALDAGDIELRADDTEPTGAPIVLTVDVVDGDGGSDSASWSVTVTNANDEPVLTTQPVSVGENGSRLLTTADLNVTDADQPGVAPGTVYSVDTSGTGLTLYNTATSSSVASFNWTALDAGDIELRADDTEPTGAPIVLTVDVVDGDGGSDSASWSVTVTNANDEPVLTTLPVSVGENGSRLLTTADLNVTDADQPGVAPGTVYSVDTSGTGLTLYNTATSSSVASFNWTALDAGDIELRADDTEPTGAPIVLTVDVVDGDGGSDSASWSVTVTNANDEPVLTTQPVSVGERAARLLSTADLSVTDVDQPGVAPGTVYSIDTSGTGLTLYNTATSSSVASFNWTALDAGDIELRADDTEPTGAPIVLTVDVVDGDGGSDSASWSVTVTNANDEPVLTTQPVILAELGSLAIDGSVLIASDAETVARGNLVFDIADLPTGMSLHLNADGPPITQFTAAELDTGLLLRFDDTEPTGPYTLRVSLADDAGGLTTADWIVAVTSTNDVPDVTTGTLSVAEDGAAVVDASVLFASDPDAADAPEALVYEVLSLPAGASLVSGAGALPVERFDQADVEAGRLRYVHGGAEPSADTDRLVLRLSDASGASVDVELAIEVTPVNDGPTLSAGTLIVDEGATIALDGAVLAANDVDDLADRLIFTVAAASDHGELLRDGQAVDSFTAAELQQGRIAYRHDGSETVDDEIRLQLRDTDGATATAMLIVRIDPVNDRPVAHLSVVDMVADAGGTVQLPADSFSDADHDELSYEATLVDGGALPDWLAFDPATLTFDVVDAERTVQRLDVRIVARDAAGEAAFRELALLFDVVEPMSQAASPSPIDTDIVPREPVSVPAQPVAIVATPREPEPTIAPEPELAISTEDDNRSTMSTVDIRTLIEPLPRAGRPVESTSLVTPLVSAVDSNGEAEPELDELELDALLALLAGEQNDADPALLDALDREREKLQEQAKFAQTVVGSTIGVTSGLSIGYLIWLIRGGTLAGSMLSSLPAWRFVDPLPVLGSLGDRAGDGDDESLQSIVSQTNVVKPPTAGERRA